MKVAVIGATGLVGSTMMKVLESRRFPVTELWAGASERSAGSEILFNGTSVKVHTISEVLAAKPDIALFSAGSGPSLEWAPQFAAAGCFVIDNSSAWRMNPEVPLVVPEINADTITRDTGIIANPNCSTIQMVVALNPIHLKYGISHIVVSTYQSVSGSGVKALQQLQDETLGKEAHQVYAHPIYNNVLPHIDAFLENGYTKEEMKMVNETRKILRDEQIRVSPTAVRVPVISCHSESVQVTCKQLVHLDALRLCWSDAPGVILQDAPEQNIYPMPVEASGKDEVFVGRLRMDLYDPNTFHCWIVADNIRKGAATNAVQIAEYIRETFLS